MSEELIESVKLVDIEGIPSFIFITRRADALENLFRLFPLSITTLDVDRWRQMPLPPETVIPEDASLRIEFSLDDIQLGQLLWTMYVSAEMRWSMSARNIKSKTLNISIQDKSSGKTIQIPGNQSPYILDWSGIGGLVYAIRSNQWCGF